MKNNESCSLGMQLGTLDCLMQLLISRLDFYSLNQKVLLSAC